MKDAVVTNSINTVLVLVRLVPPSLSSGTEVILGPRREHDLAIVGNVTVGKSERKRSRSTDNGSIRSVLRSVARAHELVVGRRPWHNASQVSADGIQTVVFEGLVLLDNKVCGISLQTLGQRAVISRLFREVGLGEDIVTKGILGRGTTGATSSTRRDKERNVRDTDSANSKSTRSEQDQVHQESTFFINVQFFACSHVGGYNRTSTTHFGRCKGNSRPSGEKSGNDGQKLHGC
mmetsp:Transcript_17756/g.28675  ORF Transcript_17756/g.28675 Transcript_17756/m.28675 type:complete len:234 (+) Transcript_17756:218-919(+)